MQFSVNGEHTVMLSESEQFPVERGDALIMEFKEGQSVPFKKLYGLCDEENRSTKRYIKNRSQDYYAVGDQIRLNFSKRRRLCQAYMIQAIIKVIEI